MTWLYIGAPILLLAVLFLTLLWLVFRKTFFVSAARRRSADPYAMPPGFEGEEATMLGLIRAVDERPYERVEITARDGTRLVARYHHVADGAPLQIQCHGYRGAAVRDFCGGNPLAREMGHNTLLIDQRGAGESGGSVITFGIRERYDILDWIDYALGRFGDVPIFLVGVSMGGASVLMASGEALPASVMGVVADCPYSAPADIIQSVIRKMHLNPRYALPLVRRSARLFGGFSLYACTAREAVTRAKIPMLLLHGEADTLVPCDMSREIAAAGELATLHTFPNANHGASFMRDPDRYRAAVIAFCSDCLAHQGKPTGEQ